MKKLGLFFCVIVSVGVASSCASTYTRNNEKVITAYMESKNLKYYIRPGKMIAEHANVDAYVMIDFSYQMNKRAYVSDAYTNFTCYNRLGAFVLSITFDDGNTQSFVATDDLKERIFEAFSK